VNHAVGTLRIPYKPRFDASFNWNTVGDEDLRGSGTQRLYVCDM
jgi:hypothetical protein